MSWPHRIIVFAVAFASAIFLSPWLTLVQFIVGAMLLTLVLYYYSKLPDFLTAIVDRLVYRETAQARKPAQRRREPPTLRERAPDIQSDTRPEARDSVPRHSEPREETEPPESVSHSEPGTNDLFRLFDARRFVDSLRHKIVAQNQAIQGIAESLSSYFSKLHPTRPLSILIAGYDSSGKTELLKQLPIALATAFPAQIRIIPEYKPIAQGESIDSASVKPKPQSKRVLVHCYDDIARLSESAQRELTTLLDDSEKAGLILLCSVSADVSPTTNRAELSSELGQLLQPSLVSRFEHVISLTSLEYLDKVRVLLIILHSIIDEYGVKLSNDRARPLLALAEDAAERWSNNDVEGIHSARQYLEKAVSKALQTARTERWQTVTVNSYNPDTESISVSPSRVSPSN